MAPQIKLVVGADVFGEPLKNLLKSYAESKRFEVEDLGVDKYYAIAETVAKKVQHGVSSEAVTNEGETAQQTRGLLVCGTGMGVGIFANKFPKVFAAVCENEEAARNSRSINNSNVLALGGEITDEETAKKIFDSWIETNYKDPCPASNGEPWGADTQKFLDAALEEMGRIGVSKENLGVKNVSKVSEEAGAETSGGAERHVAAPKSDSCPICKLAKDRVFVDVAAMPGGSWEVLRESPGGTAALVRFRAGSVEPAHHHTFGHDVVVTAGSKRVYNLTAGTVHDLAPGDYLYTPAGDSHRVVYFTDTEFFIKWDGPVDILLDESLEVARAKLMDENVPLES